MGESTACLESIWTSASEAGLGRRLAPCAVVASALPWLLPRPLAQTIGGLFEGPAQPPRPAPASCFALCSVDPPPPQPIPMDSLASPQGVLDRSHQYCKSERQRAQQQHSKRTESGTRQACKDRR